MDFNPLNWRRHPDAQQAALAKVLSRIGWVTGVIENVTTGNLIDGHARIDEAMKVNPQTPVPFTQVELTEGEERQILLLLDPLSSMAETDDDRLNRLMELTLLEDEDLLLVLGDYAAIIPDLDELGESFSLPDGDRAGFQQLTFSVTDDQAAAIKEALSKAKDAGAFGETGNENSNGNALARIAEAYG